MRQDTIQFDSGVVDYEVNGHAHVRFNPSDEDFIGRFYTMATAVRDAIAQLQEETKNESPLEAFRASDRCCTKLEALVDTLFGAGFCEAAFEGARPLAMAGGLTLIENLIFAVMDKLDASVTGQMQQRNEAVKKYTAKYDKYLRRGK